jgi:hypothetical protein
MRSGRLMIGHGWGKWGYGDMISDAEFRAGDIVQVLQGWVRDHVMVVDEDRFSNCYRCHSFPYGDEFTYAPASSLKLIYRPDTCQP